MIHSIKLKMFSIVLSLLMLFTINGLTREAEKQREEQFLSNVRQLIYDGKRSGEGYFSPDGKLLTFQSEREPGNPFFQIYLLNLETGESHLISTGTGKTTCSFIRPGVDEVLFASSHLDPEALREQEEEYELRKSNQDRRYSWDYDTYMDIFTTRKDGSGIQQLSDAYGYDAEGSYSPDGSKIVFCSLRSGYPGENSRGTELSEKERDRLKVDPSYFGEIYIMNADGSDQKRLTDRPGYDGGPFFSPDGKRIVWRHFDESGIHADVYTMNSDGSDVRRITDFGAMSWAPYYHPSMEYIVFASNKLGFSNFEVYMVDARGEKEPVRITYSNGFDGLPVFSPDGKMMVWTSGRTPKGDSQLFIANWNHQAALAALQAAPQRNAASAASASDASTAVTAGAAAAPVMKTAAVSVQSTPEISAADLRTKVEYLASDELEGRMTGTTGTEKAAAYIASHFEKSGLKPAGDNGTFFQEFPFTSGVKVLPERNHLTIMKPGQKPESISPGLDEDFRPLAFTSDGEVEGDVVFAGYGLSVPGESGRGYDSYEGLDVKDKIVLVLHYVPEEVSVERRQELNPYAALQFKAMAARKQGAKAMLVVTGPTSPNAGELVSLSFDRAMGSAGIFAASISGKAAEILFAGSGKDLQAIQTELDQENPHEGGFVLPDVKVKLSTAVEREKTSDRNVLALLPPGDDAGTEEYILIGAHYDHIGHGEIGSLARKGEEGQIHNGADDNASGTATVLELAAALSDRRKNNPAAFPRGIIFGLWSGEELGIIGSSYFAKNPTVSLEKVLAYFNFDMVGRLKDNTLMLQGIGSSAMWKKIIERRNIMAGFNLVLQEDPYLPTDVTAFYPKGVPVVTFFTGSHEDYNRPSDDPQTLDYEGMERIAKLADNMIMDVVNQEERPDYVKVERKQQPGGGRGNLRAYLGTVPDFVASDIEGVRLSSVRAGGPADKAGLKGGDIIIELAGQKITNIYDYTYTLDAVKIGVATDIIVLREDQKVTMKIVPEVRK
jgi:Tol biopolymer transport system component